MNGMRTCKAALAWAVLFGFAVPAGADVVTEWNIVALTSIRATSMPPPRASRALAILHAAMYDAVNGIARTHEAYLYTARCRPARRWRLPRAARRIASSCC